MSIWSLIDDGLSIPDKPRNLRTRFVCWLGRRLALRHKNVVIPKSCRIHPGAKIHPRGGKIILGEECIIAEGAILQGNISLGNHCSVQSYTLLVGYGNAEETSGKITIGRGVRIASHGMLIAANHRFKDATRPIHLQGLTFAPITIEDNVWIGGGVHIIAGVTIGTGSVIAAGAVVTKDVPAGSLAMGVPAKHRLVNAKPALPHAGY